MGMSAFKYFQRKHFVEGYTKYLELPPANPLPGSEVPNFPFFLIVYDAIGLNTNLLRPFEGKEGKIFLLSPQPNREIC